MDFAGKPLFVWSVIQSTCSHLIDETYVSTDDPEIAAVAMQYGARVIRRPVLHSDVSANPIYRHAIEEIRKDRPDLDTILTILPTSPLKHPFDLDESIRLFRKMPRDGMVFPTVPEQETVVYERGGEDGKTPVPIIGDKSRAYMTQGGAWNVCSPDVYMQVTNLSLVRDSEIDGQAKELIKSLQRDYENYPLEWYYPLQEYQQFDIDSYEDFVICEAVFKRVILVHDRVYEDYAACDLLGSTETEATRRQDSGQVRRDKAGERVGGDADATEQGREDKTQAV